MFQSHRYRSESIGFLTFYAQPGQSSTSGIGAGECCLLARRASLGLHPWHAVEVFHQCELPYLTSPFRHTPHTPALVRENYSRASAHTHTHTECAELNPPTRPTHAPANTHINTHTLTQQLRHKHTDTPGTSRAADSQTPLLEAFLTKPCSAPRHLTRITLHFPGL